MLRFLGQDTTRLEPAVSESHQPINLGLGNGRRVSQAWRGWYADSPTGRRDTARGERWRLTRSVEAVPGSMVLPPTAVYCSPLKTA
jgi:hypothetical protein